MTASDNIKYFLTRERRQSPDSARARFFSSNMSLFHHEVPDGIRLVFIIKLAHKFLRWRSVLGKVNDNTPSRKKFLVNSSNITLSLTRYLVPLKLAA